MSKKISDLETVSELNDADKFLIETKNGPKAVPFNVLSENCGGSGGAMSASAASHNGIYRGVNLLDTYTIEQLHTMVAAGDFSDIYIGDYIEVTISTSYKSNETVRLLVVHLDYFYGNGSTECTSHHIVFVPEDCFATAAKMNSSSTTENGYKGSEMHSTVLPTYYTALNGADALNGHILTHYRYLSSTVTSSTTCGSGLGLTGATTGCTWAETNLCLMNETMVYGTTAYSSSALDVGDAQAQLALFQLAPHKKIAHLGYGSTSRSGWWLASVASSTNFCICTSIGLATYNGASLTYGVRPYLLFA